MPVTSLSQWKSKHKASLINIEKRTLADLRKAIAESKRRRREALKQARALCRASKLRTREKIQALRG